MSVSNVGGVSNAAFAQTYGVAVQKRSQDVQQAAGQSTLQLIASAQQAAAQGQQPQIPQTQPLQDGQTINVFA